MSVKIIQFGAIIRPRWLKSLKNLLKAEQRVIQFYFRKIPLHQQRFLVVSIFYNSPWLTKYLKNVQNETTKFFSFDNTKKLTF